MKIIKFGSFPFMEIQPKEKDCLDKYLIKHFADQISFQDALMNLAITKNTFYVGPAEIVRFMMNNTKKNKTINFTEVNTDYLGTGKDNQNMNNSYQESMKRAFSVLTNFYTKLSDSAFYKGIVYAPIYIEKLIKSGGTQGDLSKVNQKFDYSFILLTNTLYTNQRKVNELGVVNFLYIYLHLFHSPYLLNDNGTYTVPAGAGISGINKDSIVRVMKLYKYLQKFDINPINLFLSIYELIAEAREFIENNKDTTYKTEKFGFKKEFKANLMNKVSKKSSSGQFRNMLTTITNHITDLYYKEFNNPQPSNQQSSLRNADIMLSIIDTITAEKEIFDFVDDLRQGRKSRDTRVQAVADYHHYQDIISIFEELSKYNSYKVTDIITDLDINFDKDIVINQENTSDLNSISRVAGIIDRNNFDTAFNKTIIDITGYIKNILNIELTGIIEQGIQDKKKRIKDELGIPGLENQIAYIDNLNSDANIDRQLLIFKRDTLLNNPNISADETLKLQDYIDQISKLDEDLKEYNRDRGDISKLLSDKQIVYGVKISELDKNTNTGSLVTSVSNNVINNIDEALGFIYKDLENLFMNPLILGTVIKRIKNKEDILPTNQMDMKNFVEHHNKQVNFNNNVNDDVLIESQYVQLATDITYLITTIQDEINNSIGLGDIDKLSKDNKDNISNNIYKSFGTRFFPIISKYLRNASSDSAMILNYNQRLQGLHPLLGKMAKDPNNFKSFIFSTNVLSTLYNLISMTQEKMFLSGLLKRPPKKLSQTDNQVYHIVRNILGLQNNPVWVIGENKLRLLLPDFLSMTGAQIASDIPKNQLKSICKINYKDWWKHNNMGDLNSFDQSIDTSKIDNEIITKQKLKKSLQDKISSASSQEKDKYITGINNIEEEIQKLNNTKKEMIIKHTKNGNLGNIGQILSTEDNYENSKSAFKPVSKDDIEAFKDLSDEDKLNTVNPKARTMNYNLDSGTNKALFNRPKPTPIQVNPITTPMQGLYSNPYNQQDTDPRDALINNRIAGRI